MDTYLYLRSGHFRYGTVLHENDDAVPGTNTNSLISESLGAGTYTIEATTYSADQASAFTLTISGPSGDGEEETGPETGTDQCITPITGDGTIEGTWTSGCRSQVSSRGYARYYSFDLARESDVTIDLMSSMDTYLYLRSGNTRSGTGLHENDDVEPEVDTDSRISQMLAAGTYTIEATTYNTGTAGTFTLSLVGLGGTSPGEGEQLPVSDPCSRTVHSDGTFPGTWAAGYQSQVTGRGYARFYTFTLARESEVTIDLEFGVDPYLYLRGGPVRTGAALAYNDDVEPTVDTDSQIVETLAAGTYTIEATTYYPATAGAFTLIIRGLASVSAGNPGTEPQDTCDDTLDGDGVTAGTWSSGCRSSVAQRGYARYYSFTLALES